jgi:hypothetical protein
MDIDTVPTIIAATAGAAGEGSQIVIWRKTRESASELKRAGAHTTGDRTGKANIIQILMFIASLAFVWQNMEVRLNLSQRNLKALIYTRSLQC